MSLKRIHITSSVGQETLVLPQDATAEEIREMLLCALDLPFASPCMLELKTHAQAPLVIGPNLPQNTPEEPYHLEAKHGPSSDTTELKQTVASLKQQLQELEKSFQAASLSLSAQSKRVRHFSEKSTKYTFTEETRETLKTPTFDNWMWDENEMIGLFELMFTELGLVEEYSIELPVLRRFLRAIKDNYNDNPFHNFRHCFCVTQMMYGILFVTGLVEKLKPIDKLILMVACMGHDLDHPGINNAYQVNAKTDLATVYSDMSPLENHHAAMLFAILKSKENYFLSHVPEPTYKEFRKGVIRCILATDMARHGEILAAFKKCVDNFNYDDAEHKALLLQMIIKCSDISNEVRPASVAEPWVDCLLEEFFTQSDREKAEGLPVAPFMDRDKVTKPGAQIGFIGFVMIPLFELVGKLLPRMDQVILNPIKSSLAYYKEMNDKLQAK